MSRLAIPTLLACVLAPCTAAAQRAGLEQILGIGMHAYFRGDSTAAIEAITTVIDAGLEDPRGYYFRGLAYQRMGRSEEAAADFAAGAEIEAAHSQSTRLVSQSLERVQGASRLALERYRGPVRAQHLAALEERRAELASTLRAQYQQLVADAPPPIDTGQVQAELAALGDEYFNALRDKDGETLVSMLTPAAGETFAAQPFDVDISADGSWTFGEVQVDGDAASLQVTLADQGITLRGRMLWRRIDDQWLVYGQTLSLGPGQPDLILNFEDPQAMAQAAEQMGQAIIAAMGGEGGAQPAAGALPAAGDVFTEPAAPEPATADFPASEPADDPFVGDDMPAEDLPAATDTPADDFPAAADTPAGSDADTDDPFTTAQPGDAADTPGFDDMPEDDAPADDVDAVDEPFTIPQPGDEPGEPAAGDMPEDEPAAGNDETVDEPFTIPQPGEAGDEPDDDPFGGESDTPELPEEDEPAVEDMPAEDEPGDDPFGGESDTPELPENDEPAAEDIPEAA